jgi:Clp amino terminal domain, pathogenicity island component
MFERYTEKARRVIFFGRYEASQYGSPHIETEHLLLGLLREDQGLFLRLLPEQNLEDVRQQIDAHTEKRDSTPTNIDLPLSEESKKALKVAGEEADRLNHRHIGTEHLLLGVLHQEHSFAAKLLRERGAVMADLRSKIEALPSPWPPRVMHPSLTLQPAAQPSVEIHGVRRESGPIRGAIRRCHKHPWHWHKQAWTPRDVAIDRKTGRVSFDLALAADPANFILAKGGWTRDHCAVCRWELFESKDDASHGTGYSNGRDWLCTECYEKFFQGPDFFGSAYSELT